MTKRARAVHLKNKYGQLDVTEQFDTETGFGQASLVSSGDLGKQDIISLEELVEKKAFTANSVNKVLVENYTYYGTITSGGIPEERKY